MVDPTGHSAVTVNVADGGGGKVSAGETPSEDERELQRRAAESLREWRAIQAAKRAAEAFIGGVSSKPSGMTTGEKLGLAWMFLDTVGCVSYAATVGVLHGFKGEIEKLPAFTYTHGTSLSFLCGTNGATCSYYTSIDSHFNVEFGYTIGLQQGIGETVAITASDSITGGLIGSGSQESLNYGGSVGVPVYGVPVTGGIDVIHNQDGSFNGIGINGGLGTPGAEGHAGVTQSHPIGRYNLIDGLYEIGKLLGIVK